MIKIYENGQSIDAVLQRSQFDDESVNATVAKIVNDVKINGDSALKKYAKQFDGMDFDKESIFVSKSEIDEAYSKIDIKLLKSLVTAKKNILDYHKKQLQKTVTIKKGSGSVGWRYAPVEKAGIYIPGGTAAYPSTVIMNACPALAAGVSQIIMATPYRNGYVNPLTLVAANECGITKILKVGGAQAIAALAYGTDSVPKVDVLTGPGNIYVTMAKKQVFGQVGIDMIAGPSEILIIADKTANAKFIACDLLSQAEHDKLSASILITDSKELAYNVQAEVEIQLKQLSRAEIACKSIEDNGAIIIVNGIDEAFDTANKIAPEHLELCIENAESKISMVKNAGAIFLGNYSPEALGDYFAGPSHTLPTSGTARHFQVLSTDTFLKRISIINYDFTSLLKVKDDIIKLAECEGLEAHANSVKVRFDN